MSEAVILRPPQLCSCVPTPEVVLLCLAREVVMVVLGGGVDQRLLKNQEQSSARGHTLVRLAAKVSAGVRGIVPHEG